MNRKIYNKINAILLVMIASSISQFSLAENKMQGPQVTLNSPSLDGTVSGPVTVDLRFDAQENDVDIDSIKIYYMFGLFKKNITKDIISAAEVTSQGIYSEAASFPEGTHKLLIVVKDTRGVTTKKRINFTVEHQSTDSIASLY